MNSTGRIPRSSPEGSNGPVPAGRRRVWLVLGLVLGLALGWLGCAPPEQNLARARRELVFEHLGELIVRSIPAARVLGVGNPFSRRPGADASLRGAEEAALRGLQRGLGTGARLLDPDYPELKAGALEDPRSIAIPAGATTPVSFLSAPGAWDGIWKRHPEAQVLVSMVGFPADLAETRAWREADGPKWVMFLPDLRVLGGQDALREGFRSGRLLAIVLNRPGAPAESEPMARDRDSEFARRYLFVSAANLEAVLGAWPGLFR